MSRFSKPDRTPPSERVETGIPDRDEPPPDAGNEGDMLDDIQESTNPGIDSPTNRSSSDDDDNDSSGSSSGSGSSSSRSRQRDIQKPDRTPPSERVETGIPDRDGPPPDSGEEGDRLDDVQESPNPGIDSPTNIDEQRDLSKPDRRGPSERERQEAYAQSVSGVTQDDLQNVEQIETDEGSRLEAEYTDTYRERLARDQFQRRRQQARERADVDQVDDLYMTYSIDQLEFNATGDGVSVQPSEDAARQRFRERAADQFDVDESEVELIETGQGLEARAETQQQAPQRFDEHVDIGNRDVDPGLAANLLGGFGQQFRQNNAMFNLLATGGATSLRTRSGLAFRDPFIGSTRTLPGERDVDGATERLQPASQRIDTGIERAVDFAFTPAQRAAESTDVGFTDVIQSPTSALLTGPVVEGAERGVTTGIQMFNPAAGVRDSILFGDIGVRTAERATREGSEEDIQRFGEAAAETGRTAAQAAPGFVAGRAITDPASLIAAPIAGGTVLAAGTLGSYGVGRGLQASFRAGRRAGRRAVDSDFLTDQRGMAQIPRQRDSPDTISGDDIAPRPDEPDQTSIRPEFERGDDIDAGDPIQRRRARRVEDEVVDRDRDLAFQRMMERRRRARKQPDTDYREAIEFEPFQVDADAVDPAPVPVSVDLQEDAQASEVQRADAEVTTSEEEVLVSEEITRLEVAQAPQVTASETAEGQEETIAGTDQLDETLTGLGTATTGLDQEEATTPAVSEEDAIEEFVAVGQEQTPASRGRERAALAQQNLLGTRLGLRTRTGLRATQQNLLRLDTPVRTDLQITTTPGNDQTSTPGITRIPPFDTDVPEGDLGGYTTGGQSGMNMASAEVSASPEAGWFAETLEAIATGPTTAPRSDPARGVEELSSVEVAGGDLPTKFVAAEGDAVTEVGDLFGLEFGDGSESEEEDEFFAGIQL